MTKLKTSRQKKTDTLFLQFYSRTSYPPTCFELGNGFSDTYDLCKNNGDFYWVRHYYEKTIATDLPINKGTIYVSALLVDHLYRTYLWARKYPNIKFIAGGPGSCSSFLEQELPSNMIMTGNSVEEWFGVPNFSEKWNLKIPIKIPENDTIYFTYLLDNTCYWNKCIYCAYKNLRVVSKRRRRKNLNFEFKNIKYNGRKMIRLATDAIAPKHIKTLYNLPSIDNLDGYRVFLRAGTKELEALKSFDNLDWANDVRFNIGLEFPTNRMWKYMKKGYNSHDVLELLNLIKNGLFISLLLGWDNLTKEDLIDLEAFMKKIPHAAKYCAIRINKLYAIPGTYVHDTYEIGEKQYMGPFYLGFKPKLNNKQIQLNEEARKIIINYGRQKGYFILDLYK